MAKPFVLLFCGFFLLTSCNLRVEETALAEEKDKAIPDSILSNFSHTEVEEGYIRLQITAANAEIYNKEQVIFLTDLIFQELNEKGEIITEGFADEVYFYTETDNAELVGNLYVYSSEEDAIVKTDYLVWDSDQQKLKTNPENTVEVEKTDSFIISGNGFEADLNTRSILFQSGVNGVYLEEDDEN